MEKNLIGFVRLGNDKHPNGCAVVMCNLPERCVSALQMRALLHEADPASCSERSDEVGIMMNVGAVSFPVPLALDSSDH